MQFDHEKLDAYGLAVDFVAAAWNLVAALPRGHGDLGDQLRRASTSIPLNIAEGAGEYSRPEKARFYRIARRSATECAAILDVARRLQALPDDSCVQARAMLVRVVSMLVNMARSLNRGPGTGTGTGKRHGAGR
jgi:four helix bundle protein